MTHLKNILLTNFKLKIHATGAVYLIDKTRNVHASNQLYLGTYGDGSSKLVEEESDVSMKVELVDELQSSK